MALKDEHRVLRRPGLPDLKGRRRHLAHARERPQHQPPHARVILPGDHPADLGHRRSRAGQDRCGHSLAVHLGLRVRRGVKGQPQRHGQAERGEIPLPRRSRGLELCRNGHCRPVGGDQNIHGEGRVSDACKRDDPRDGHLALPAGLVFLDGLDGRDAGDLFAGNGLKGRSGGVGKDQRGEEPAAGGGLADDVIAQLRHRNEAPTGGIEHQAGRAARDRHLLGEPLCRRSNGEQGAQQ